MENSHATVQAKRCAIYTRKSFEPPLGQEITSLESQRTICASYIISQQHRGWVEIVRKYEDVGRSGANTHRPALQELLADVEAGLVDVILVYKLDRLTRTLLDFVRLSDFLARHNVALVSITQSFDTSDSLGRLVLNILLTFAQFEREILSDRMRDKIRVLKQMGRWVGGSPPLGYDVVKKRLIENPGEADAVKLIFNSYLTTQNTEAVHRILEAQGFRRKVWKSRHGRVNGGGPVTLSSLHHILRNRIYVGEVVHCGDVFPGIHKPIIDQATFDEVQKVLELHSVHRPRNIANLLTGLLFDSAGRPMCIKDYQWRGKTIRYYASNVSAWARRRKLKRMRADGSELEQLIIASLKTLLLNRERLRQLLLEHGIHGSELDCLTRAGSASARRFDSLSHEKLRNALHGLLERVELFPGEVTIVIFREELRRFLDWDGVGMFRTDADARRRNSSVYLLRAAASVVRAREIYALPVTPAPTSNSCIPDPKLIKLLDDGERARALMIQRRELDLPDLAERFGCKMSRFSRLVRLNYLAPDITLAIRDGMHPSNLTWQKLLKANLPTDWATQRNLLGFSPQPDHFRNPNARPCEITVQATPSDQLEGHLLAVRGP